MVPASESEGVPLTRQLPAALVLPAERHEARLVEELERVEHGAAVTALGHVRQVVKELGKGRVRSGRVKQF